MGRECRTRHFYAVSEDENHVEMERNVTKMLRFAPMPSSFIHQCFVFFFYLIWIINRWLKFHLFVQEDTANWTQADGIFIKWYVDQRAETSVYSCRKEYKGEHSLLNLMNKFTKKTIKSKTKVQMAR